MKLMAKKYIIAIMSVAVSCICFTASAESINVAQHGKKFMIGAAGHQITVLYLKGTPYEMGYAEGKLCSKEIHYMALQVAPLMMLGMQTTPQKVDRIWALYLPHLRTDYLEELKGEAAGSGVPLNAIQRLESLPDISEWHCSFFAAYGKATRTGDLFQIRALDYTTNAGIQKYPALKVYEPAHGIPFVNVGWAGFCGMVTGMNADGIAMSEIGDDWDMKTDSFDGRPLTYVMRDSVEFGRNLAEAVNLVKNGPRTTSLLYCLSSAREKQARALETSHTKCYVYSPGSLPFPRLQDVVYMSMGMGSAWNLKLHDALKAQYGKIDATVAQNIMHTLGTGSLHAVVFKPLTGDILVANATSTEKGCNRPFVHFNLKQALGSAFFQQRGK
jgi:hypothetical protein